VAIVLASLGLWTSIQVLRSCSFFVTTEVNPVTGQVIDESTRGYGLLSRTISYGERPEYGTQCVFYPAKEQAYLWAEDTWMRTSLYGWYLTAWLQCLAAGALVLMTSLSFTRVTFERWFLWAYFLAACAAAAPIWAMPRATVCRQNDCALSQGARRSKVVFIVLVTNLVFVRYCLAKRTMEDDVMLLATQPNDDDGDEEEVISNASNGEETSFPDEHNNNNTIQMQEM